MKSWYDVLDEIYAAKSRQDFVSLIPKVQAFRRVDLGLYYDLRMILYRAFHRSGYRDSKSFNYSML